MGPPTLQFCRLSLAHKVKLFQNRNFYYIERYLFFLLLYIHDILRSSFTILIFYFLQRKVKRKTIKEGAFITCLIEWVILMDPLPFNLLLQILVLTWLWRLSRRLAGRSHKKIKIRIMRVRLIRVSVLSLSLVHMRLLKQSDTYEFSNNIGKTSTKLSVPSVF